MPRSKNGCATRCGDGDDDGGSAPRTCAGRQCVRQRRPSRGAGHARTACCTRRRQTRWSSSARHFFLDSPTRPAILRNWRSLLGGLCPAGILSQHLAATGGQVSTVAYFLGLRREEEETLIDALDWERRMKRLSRKQPADRLQSSPSRIAKLETDAPGVTLDRLDPGHCSWPAPAGRRLPGPLQARRLVEMVVRG